RPAVRTAPPVPATFRPAPTASYGSRPTRGAWAGIVTERLSPVARPRKQAPLWHSCTCRQPRRSAARKAQAPADRSGGDAAYSIFATTSEFEGCHGQANSRQDQARQLGRHRLLLCDEEE